MQTIRAIKPKWVKTSEMSAMLGMTPISLTRRASRNDGYLEKGIHYNQLGDKNSPFYWHVDKTIEAFENWGAPTQEVE